MVCRSLFVQVPSLLPNTRAEMLILWRVQTDDTLVFRNSLVEEYALLLAAPPLGLGLPHDKISLLAKMSLYVRFYS